MPRTRASSSKNNGNPYGISRRRKAPSINLSTFCNLSSDNSDAEIITVGNTKSGSTSKKRKNNWNSNTSKKKNDRTNIKKKINTNIHENAYTNIQENTENTNIQKNIENTNLNIQRNANVSEPTRTVLDNILSYESLSFDCLSDSSDGEVSSVANKSSAYTPTCIIYSDSDVDPVISSNDIQVRDVTPPHVMETTSNEFIQTEMENHSENEVPPSDDRPPPTLSDNDLSDDSNEDLYECDFINLKKTACSELKKYVEQQPEIIPAIVKDIDSDFDLSPTPIGRVYKPRTSRKSKLIQIALEAARDKLCQQQMNCSDTLESSVLDDVLIVENVLSVASVRVCWGTAYNRYDVSLDEPFVNLYSKLAEEHQVNVAEIVLSLNGKIITHSDTINTIGYAFIDIIEGGVIKKPDESGPGTVSRIPLKIQCANQRDSVILNISKFAKMEALMEEYAALKNSHISKFTFRFDGEILSPTETPFSLDLEGDECIDVYQIP